MSDGAVLLAVREAVAVVRTTRSAGRSAVTGLCDAIWRSTDRFWLFV